MLSVALSSPQVMAGMVTANEFWVGGGSIAGKKIEVGLKQEPCIIHKTT